MVIAYRSVLLSTLMNRYQAEGNVKALAMLKKILPMVWQHIHFLEHYACRDKRDPIDVEALLANIFLLKTVNLKRYPNFTGFGHRLFDSLEILKIMEWIPVVLVTFKLLVFGVGMFFAIKWHYDKGAKEKEMDMRALLRACGKVAAIFVLSLLVLGCATFALSKMLGLDLSWP